VLDLWVVDAADSEAAGRAELAGLPALATDLLMRDPSATAAFVGRAVAAVRR
jgi:LPPG:FO 2-phospho-L-lactate transferase